MLEKNTLQFLKDIALNNDRAWFSENKVRYEAARENVLQLTEQIISNLPLIDKAFDQNISPKKCVLRIYRDVRFSKNKNPYKTNFGIWFSGSLTNNSGPGYYLHIQPGNSFIGAGYWMPNSDHLKLIRQEIDYNSTEFHEIIDAPLFRDNFSFSTSEQLKNAPKGYDIEHIDIAYLKLKSFEVSRPLPDELLFTDNLTDELLKYYTIVYPFIDFLRKSIA